ncbi:hypothetical protein [Endozoicomonas sp. ONNA2]|uniref:hypothetical protein n=1 Tax=Endozoicomonas sp. ONNA2 TaxID=2828741 RepID=UPI002148D197|nr:hypothetical protein [Endozoicomonas sp. ONNA2]
MLPECPNVASSSQELLLRANHRSSDQAATVFYPKRTLKKSNEECCLRQTSSMSNLQQMKDTLDSRVCQRLATSQMICGERVLPSSPEQISPLLSDKSNKKLTVYAQPLTTEKPDALQDKKSQSEHEFKIESLEIINSLNTIINGEGVWSKFRHSIIRCCSDGDQWTSDEDWLDYVDCKIKIVDKHPNIFWNKHPGRLKLLIQEIIFITLKTLDRYERTLSAVNPGHLTSLNDALHALLQQCYQRFGEELFWQIFNPGSYDKRTQIDQLQFRHLTIYNFNVIPITLKTLLAPGSKTLAYLPVLWHLRNNTLAVETVLGIDKQTIQQMAEKKEQHRLLKLFTHRPQGRILKPLDSMEGFSNFGNTCFAAVSTWQILVSPYIQMLSAASESQTAECGFQGVRQGQNEQTMPLIPEEKATPLENLSLEQCLTLLRKESNRNTKTRLLITAIRKCLVTMQSQYLIKQYPQMQKVYELLLTLCAMSASEDIFHGFENFHEKYAEFKNIQLLTKKTKKARTEKNVYPENVLGHENLLPIFPLKKLPQQDSAEFLAPLLELVMPKEQLKKCAFWLLTERRIMRGPDIVTITDNPGFSPGSASGVSAVKDTDKPDTFIYLAPVSLEQAERDDFSIQVILDDALSLKNLPENMHQKITINSDNFRHAIHNNPDSLSRAKETGTGDHLWDVLQERQVLLVEEIPEVITIQPKMPPELLDRAKVTEKLAQDVTEEFQLTFRKVSHDAALPPEDIIQKYRIVAKVFYVEDEHAITRHYRCLINGRGQLPGNDEQQEIDKVVMDDKNVFIAPAKPGHLYQLGVPCMFTAEKITALKPDFQN